MKPEDEPRWSTIAIFAAFDVVVVAAIVASSITDEADGPAWLEAISTLTAFTAAAVAARFAYDAYRTAASADQREAKREQRYLDERRSEQASRITAWVAVGSPPGKSIRRLGVFIRNASNAVALDARIAVWAETGDGLEFLGLQTEFTVPPTQNASYQRFQAELDDAYKGWSMGVAPDTETAFRTAMIFTDAAGVRWERWRDGKLSETLRPFWSDPWHVPES